MKKLAILFALAIMVAGCKKTDQTTNNTNTITSANNGKFLSKITYWTPSTNKEAILYELVLDASGNLTGLNTYSTNTAGSQIYGFTSLDKDASGNIIKISGTDKTQGTSIDYQFVYDASGNVTKATFTKGTVISTLFLYTYDSANRLLTVDERSAANTQTFSLHTFTYTGTAGSPSAEKEEIKNTFPLQTNNYTLEFDTKSNPSQAAPKILYYMGMTDFFKNNITKRTDGTYTSTFTYEYNSNGFPTQKKAGVDAGLKYTYEK